MRLRGVRSLIGFIGSPQICEVNVARGMPAGFLRYNSGIGYLVSSSQERVLVLGAYKIAKSDRCNRLGYMRYSI